MGLRKDLWSKNVPKFSSPEKGYSLSTHILLKIIPPCPSKTGEGTVVKEEECRESTFRDR